MATVNVENGTYTVESLYQWDVNQTLVIYGLSLPSVPEVHFTNKAMGKAIVRQATMDAAGVVSAEVPNSLLQNPYPIQAYVCLYEGATFETRYKIDIPMIARNKPEDYTLKDDPEVYSFNALDNKVANALAQTTAAKAAADAATAAAAEAKAAGNAAATKADAAATKADAAQATATAAKTSAEAAAAAAEAAVSTTVTASLPSASWAAVTTYDGAAYSGGDLWSQTVSMAGVTANTCLSILADNALALRMETDGASALWAETAAGAATFYVRVAALTADVTVTCLKQEVAAS